jgi:hypothetical protein
MTEVDETGSDVQDETVRLLLLLRQLLRLSFRHAHRGYGQKVEDVISKASEPTIHERLKAETDAARTYGIFGSPAFVVDGETFWGDDRLEEALAWAVGRHRLQKPSQVRAETI